MIYWTCHVCGKERPDPDIAVEKVSIRTDFGRITINVRYCRDDPSCQHGIPQCSLVRGMEEAFEP